MFAVCADCYVHKETSCLQLWWNPNSAILRASNLLEGLKCSNSLYQILNKHSILVYATYKEIKFGRLTGELIDLSLGTPSAPLSWFSCIYRHLVPLGSIIVSLCHPQYMFWIHLQSQLNAFLVMSINFLPHGGIAMILKLGNTVLIIGHIFSFRVCNYW